MTNAPLFTCHTLAEISSDDPRQAAKLAYVAAMESYTQPRPKGRKPIEQLVSPAEHIQLALITLTEEAAALRALLATPTFLPTHRTRAAQAAEQIEKAAQTAESFFRIVKPLCIHKEVYDRRRAAP